MNSMKNKNEKLKKILYEFKDYLININLENKTDNIKTKIIELNNEKNLIEKQLGMHQICIKEQNEIKEELGNYQKELGILKENIKQYNYKIKELINNNNSKTNFYIKGNMKINLNLIKKNFGSNSTPNLKVNNYRYKNEKRNNNKNIELPKISSNSLIVQNKSKINNDFLKIIKDIFNEDEFISLKNKINKIENNNRVYKKHSLELNKYDSKIITLEERNKDLNIMNKESNLKFRSLKNILHSLKNENKIELKKVKELKKELKIKEKILKEKKDEISSLQTEINSIKNAVKNDDIQSTRGDIIQYVKKLKKEKRNKNRNKINKNKKEKSNNNDGSS